VLQLEHKNGVRSDFRIDNLELLCPNCHSQTSTFAGRNHPFKKPSKERPASRRQPPPRQPERTTWPSREDLQKLAWAIPTSRIAQQLGVSDVAVAKRMKRLRISKPPRGYWAQVAAGISTERPSQFSAR
jgi:hypothetical protein